MGGEFSEEAHPRESDGKFTAGGGPGHTQSAGEKAGAASARASKTGTASAHREAKSQHLAAARARRAAADKEKDPGRRAEHLAQASHHEGKAGQHAREAAAHEAREGVAKEADAHEKGAKSEAKVSLFKRLAGKLGGGKGEKKPEHGEGEHAGGKHGEGKEKGEHGKKGEGKEKGEKLKLGSEEGLTHKAIESVGERIKGSLEFAKDIEGKVLKEGGLGAAAKTLAGSATKLPGTLVRVLPGGEAKEKGEE